MKNLKLFILTIMLTLVFVLVSCGNESDPSSGGQTGGEGLVVQVGTESLSFYQEKLNAYAKEHNLGYKITVKAADTGSAADNFLKDPSAGPDIFTIAHDNIGKLVAGSGNIDPFTNQALLEQMENQNPESFLDVVYVTPGDGGEQACYAVPYISQALVLYYDTRVASAEDVKSLESMLACAKRNNRLAVAWTGTDGYNFSSFLLARPYNEAAKAVFGNSGTLKLYQNGQLAKCDCTGDDMVAIMKYAQRFINDPNGRNGVANNGYATEIQNDEVLGFISGSWKYNEAVSAWGEENVGIASLPTFKLTKADEFGTAKEGMEFKSGSFVDCKCFVKKKGSKYASELDSIIKYLTSDAIQKESYEKCKNLPASTSVDLGEADALTLAQQEMANWGIPQPFGFTDILNGAYYSKGAPDRFVAIVQNANNKYGEKQLVTELQTITFVWTKLDSPASVEKLNEWLAKDTCYCSNKTPATELNK